MERLEGRKANELRQVRITRSYLKYPEGSVLMEMGDTRVICTASVEDKVPTFLKGQNKGWITAEYGLLPRSTQVRSVREAAKGHPGGRTYEIQRLIGRSLRSVVDLAALKERTIWIDCDVIQADGGTRTAAITGSFIALVDALRRLADQEGWPNLPVTDYVAAVSVGKIGDEILLDLNYQEDSQAQVDMNVVMTGRGQLVEIQGTAEGSPFSKEEMDAMLALAWQGIEQLIAYQRRCLGEVGELVGKWIPRADGEASHGDSDSQP